MNKCSVPGCTSTKYYAKGLCSKHYQRQRTRGTSDDHKGHHLPIEIKFWKQVNKDGKSITPVGTPCWIWLGLISPKGYGRVWWKSKDNRAHRVAWALLCGKIPKNKILLHRCDTALCVNPDHLFIGTQSDNVQDCVGKGRRGKADHRGEKSGRAKLTDADIVAIRKDSRTHQVVAKDYGVDPSTVCDIRNRKTWPHVP